MALLVRKDRKLTDAEKAYGKRFRDAAQAELTLLMDTDPPMYFPPNFVVIFRHLCDARKHKESTALPLKEIYVSSEDQIPAGVPPRTLLLGGNPNETHDDSVWWGHAVEAGHFDAQHPGHVNGLDEVAGLPEFAFIYKEGKCAKCEATARSRAGRFVLASERPPTAGRMSRS